MWLQSLIGCWLSNTNNTTHICTAAQSTGMYRDIFQAAQLSVVQFRLCTTCRDHHIRSKRNKQTHNSNCCLCHGRVGGLLNTCHANCCILLFIYHQSSLTICVNKCFGWVGGLTHINIFICIHFKHNVHVHVFTPDVILSHHSCLSRVSLSCHMLVLSCVVISV